MSPADLERQLSILRGQIAKIDRKYARPRPLAAPPLDERRPERYFVEEWLSGQEVETPHGRHFETERLFERHRRHGSADISALAELPEDLLREISEGLVRAAPPARWAFLDTETTGLAGGPGVCAFLVGVGRITPEGFRLRQFFMRHYGEEASLLHGLAEHLSGFDVLVTYNGRVYDQPLLETRFRAVRARSPFARLDHADLLYGARRLWKLRFEGCRLVDLENRILGLEREGDLPGEMIPYVYFEYLRKGEAFRLTPIFHHNAMDIVTLACFTAIVPWAFRSPETAPLSHPSELVGLGRWLRQAGRLEPALRLFRRAIEEGLADGLLFRTLWDVAMLEKKLGREPAAVALLAELSESRNVYQAAALEELAKHHEHGDRDYARALEFTRAALLHQETPALRRREARLARRLQPAPKKARRRRKSVSALRPGLQ